MNLNYIEPTSVKFDEVPKYRTFISDEKVYIRISDNSAVYIGGSLVNTFNMDELVYPCIVEEVSVKKV